MCSCSVSRNSMMCDLLMCAGCLNVVVCDFGVDVCFGVGLYICVVQ